MPRYNVMGVAKSALDASVRYLAFILVALLINATLSANLSGVYDRYQSRVVWLLGVGLWCCVASRVRARFSSG